MDAYELSSRAVGSLLRNAGSRRRSGWSAVGVRTRALAGTQTKPWNISLLGEKSHLDLVGVADEYPCRFCYTEARPRPFGQKATKYFVSEAV